MNTCGITRVHSLSNIWSEPDWTYKLDSGTQRSVPFYFPIPHKYKCCFLQFQGMPNYLPESNVCYRFV